MKEWDYYYVGNDHFGVALTIADNSYMGLDSISYYNRFTVKGTAASRVFFRIVAKAVRMRAYWPDVFLQGLTRPLKSLSASLSFAVFDLCR